MHLRNRPENGRGRLDGIHHVATNRSLYRLCGPCLVGHEAPDFGMRNMMNGESHAMAGNQLASVEKVLKRAIAVAAMALMTTACGSTPASEAPQLGSIEVVNQTADNWTLTIGGSNYGNVPPNNRKVYETIPPGQVLVMVKNASLQLSQRSTLPLASGAHGRFFIKPQYGKLRIVNPRDKSVDISVDGVLVGRARAAGETTFQSVVAGQRRLVGKSPGSASQLSTELFLGEGKLTTWTLAPDAAATPSKPAAGSGAVSTVPRPKPGQALLWIRNFTDKAVEVDVDNAPRGVVRGSTDAEIHVAPGYHTVEIRRQGVGARTTHTVTVKADQVARLPIGQERTGQEQGTAGTSAGASGSSEPGGFSQLDVPRPPDGKAVVWFRNFMSRGAIVSLNGQQVAVVPPGGKTTLVVAPGSHTIVVRRDGMATTSEHYVTIGPNQVADLPYGR